MFWEILGDLLKIWNLSCKDDLLRACAVEVFIELTGHRRLSNTIKGTLHHQSLKPSPLSVQLGSVLLFERSKPALWVHTLCSESDREPMNEANMGEILSTHIPVSTLTAGFWINSRRHCSEPVLLIFIMRLIQLKSGTGQSGSWPRTQRCLQQEFCGEPWEHLVLVEWFDRSLVPDTWVNPLQGTE